MQTHLEEDATYFSALSHIRGIGQQTLLRLALSFPTQHHLMQASAEELEQQLGLPGKRLSELLSQTPERWQDQVEQAREQLLHHLQQGIVPIAFTSQCYPLLLKHISDPPVILYAKGNLDLLRSSRNVAIVGTREPTLKGRHVAQHLAGYFAEQGYTIISGLAKGIDAAAHTGALDAKGKTIAVFGTGLDTVYPAEHRTLAESILAQSGLLVSELPAGKPAFKRGFVLRDRIQSGLCLAVIPVQTRKDGGTMHTVSFARAQERLVACPVPLKDEKLAVQYEGIWSLIRDETHPLYSFRAGQIHNGHLLARIRAVRQRLLPEVEDEEEERELRTHGILPEQLPLLAMEVATTGEVQAEHPQKRKKPGNPPERLLGTDKLLPLFAAALPLSRLPLHPPAEPITEPLAPDATPVPLFHALDS